MGKMLTLGVSIGILGGFAQETGAGRRAVSLAWNYDFLLHVMDRDWQRHRQVLSLPLILASLSMPQGQWSVL